VTATDLQKPLGKKPVNRQQADTVPNQTRAPSPRAASAQPPPVKSGNSPPGAFQPVPVPPQPPPRRDPTYPVVHGGVYPGQSAPNPQSTLLGVGPAPSVFSQYTPLPADVSLSKLAGLKQWFLLYRRSILLGGGMGVAVVIIMVIIMRACGDSPPPAAPDAMPIDANEIRMSPPVDAATAPPDAAKVHKPRKGSGSAQ
jgi:hypothetical protein